MSSLEKREIEFACEDCSQTYSLTYKWIRAQKNLACSCGKLKDLEMIRFKMEFDELQKQVRKASPA